MADIHKQSQVQLVLDQLNSAPLVKEIVYDILTIERISNKQFNAFTTPIINQLLDIAAANSGIMSYRHFHNMLVTMSWIEAQVKVLLNLDETQLYMQRSAVIEKLDEVNLILDEIMIDSQYGVDGHIVKIDGDGKSLLRRPNPLASQEQWSDSLPPSSDSSEGAEEELETTQSASVADPNLNRPTYRVGAISISFPTQNDERRSRRKSTTDSHDAGAIPASGIPGVSSSLPATVLRPSSEINNPPGLESPLAHRSSRISDREAVTVSASNEVRLDSAESSTQPYSAGLPPIYGAHRLSEPSEESGASELGLDDELSIAANLAIGYLPSPGVTHYTIDKLCEKIHGTPELANMPISELHRREFPFGVQHEFIMVRSMDLQGWPIVWIRIDRAALGYRERVRLSIRYPANDTALMGTNDDYGSMAEESRLRARVAFDDPLQSPRFSTLADLLAIMEAESSQYSLTSQNCYFFTSVIQEILTELHGGTKMSGSLGHRHLAKSTRTRIRQRYMANKRALDDSAAILDEERNALDPISQGATPQKPSEGAAKRVMRTPRSRRPQ